MNTGLVLGVSGTTHGLLAFAPWQILRLFGREVHSQCEFPGRVGPLLWFLVDAFAPVEGRKGSLEEVA